MGMYDDILTGVSENIEIMGYPFYAENIQGEEPFNRREIIQKPLLNGTMITKRGRYVQRKFSFKTTLFHGDGRADAHDDILREINSKPVEVISQSMGGKFKAVVTFTKDIFEGSPFHTDYDVDVIEVPESSSNIRRGVCVRHLRAGNAVHDDLAARVAGGLEQDGVHAHVWFNARRLRLHDLRAAHLTPVAGHAAVERHVLALEGRDAVSVLPEDAAQRRAQQALARAGHGALYHDALRAHRITSVFGGDSPYFAVAAQAASEMASPIL